MWHLQMRVALQAKHRVGTEIMCCSSCLVFRVLYVMSCIAAIHAQIGSGVCLALDPAA